MDVHLPRRRLLTFDARPEAVRGKKLYLLNWEKYLQREHKYGGWKPKPSCETQAEDDFRFDGRALGEYCAKALGIQPGKVYFPAAFTGKVAKALSDAGCDVFATDLSDHWASHLRSLGLRAEKRSFEELPGERFDAVVSFEPYCVSRAVAYLAMLRMLSLAMPYIEIDLAETRLLDSEMKTWKRWSKRKIRDIGYAYPFRRERHDRIGYDYGADYDERHFRQGSKLFKFGSVVPTPTASARASLDLKLLEGQKTWAEGKSVSLKALAGQFGEPLNEIAAAVKRLMDVLNKRLGLEIVLTGRCTDALNCARALPKTQIQGYIREVLITE